MIKQLVPVSLAILDDHQTVDLNVPLTRIVQVIKLVQMRNAWILVQVLVEVIQTAEQQTTDPNVIALLVTKVIRTWAVSINLNHPDNYPHLNDLIPVTHRLAELTLNVALEMGQELVSVIPNILEIPTWNVDLNVCSTQIAPMTRLVYKPSVRTHVPEFVGIMRNVTCIIIIPPVNVSLATLDSPFKAANIFEWSPQDLRNLLTHVIHLLVVHMLNVATPME